MPIIYTYPSATPTASDLLIFSDVSATDPAKDTRKCTVGDIVDLAIASVPSDAGGTITSVKLDLASHTTDTGLRLWNTGGGTFSDTSQTYISGAAVFELGGKLGARNGGTGADTLTGVLKGNGTGAFTASDVILTAGGTQEVSGILPVTHGGIGIGATFTKGDILYASGVDAVVKLGIAGPGEILNVSSGGIPAWTLLGDAGIVTSVDVSGGSTGLVFTGGPINTTGTITLASGQLIVANGGTGAATFTAGSVLLGNGTSAITPTASMTNGQLLIGNTGNPPSLATLTAGPSGNITITNSSGGIEIESSGGGGIYSASGSLSGATVVTTGANDLTFTATTGDIIFNNNVSPNPAMWIDGATNSIGIGGNFNSGDQLSIYNQDLSGNTTALGIQGNNTVGDQKGIDIDISNTANENVGIKVNASGATSNYAIVTDGGNSGFGSVSPDDSAIVEMASETQGFLPPRMTTVQMNAITLPAKGLMVYDITTDQWMGNNGTPGSPNWVIIG